MIYFTSDTHFGDPRLNLYGRDFIATTSDEIDELIINNWNSIVTEKDTVFVIGDFCYDQNKISLADRLIGKKYFIKGNYDDKISNDILNQYFDKVYDGGIILNDPIIAEKVYINHYPVNGKDDIFNIVGHIHGTWKVQRNMINVGTDAWHFYPVSAERIKFQINGIRNHYDQNVFAGELECNLKYKK